MVTKFLGKKPHMKQKKIKRIILFNIRNNESGNIESRIQIGCAPCTTILVYTLRTVRKRLPKTRLYSVALCLR